MIRDPSARLANLAAELKMTVFELPTARPLCFVAGLLRPRVVISTGAVNCCSTDELRAALLHERDHCRGRATLWATVASFLNDCSPLPVKRAIELLHYRSELAADREASRHTDPSVLVSAMIKLAEPALNSPFIANFADHAQLKNRVESLLIPDSPRSRPVAGICAALLLAAVAGLAWIPFGLHTAIRILTCRGCM
jgi:Zn-dependent protease with chaperone function